MDRRQRKRGREWHVFPEILNTSRYAILVLRVEGATSPSNSLALSLPLTISFNAFKHSHAATTDIGGVISSRLPVCDMMVWYWVLQINKHKLPVSMISFSLVLNFHSHSWNDVLRKPFDACIRKNYTANHFTAVAFCIFCKDKIHMWHLLLKMNVLFRTTLFFPLYQAWFCL